MFCIYPCKSVRITQFFFHKPAKTVRRPGIFRQPYENKILSIFLFTNFFYCDTLSSSAKFRDGIHSVAASTAWRHPQRGGIHSVAAVRDQRFIREDLKW